MKSHQNSGLISEHKGDTGMMVRNDLADRGDVQTQNHIQNNTNS